MNKVFDEEVKHLSQLEQELKHRKEICEDNAKRLSQEWQDFPVFDLEDASRKKQLLIDKESELRDAERIASYIPEPYFGRIDIENTSGKIDVFYIGKQAVSFGALQLVADWRSPIGEKYYAQRDANFVMDGIMYNMLLKRSLDIKNGELISLNTIFDVDDVALSGQVVDEFLHSVLKDKRRSKVLTDIIVSIQQNQNEIIRRPLRESFVVQGCAGSGKTMILLHRLSNLLYNNQGLDVSRIKILTPNSNFNTYINELSSQLGLNKIEKMSVSEYYSYLISKYGISVDGDNDIKSEKSLNPNLLRLLYSEKYYKVFSDLYHRFWEDAIGEIRQTGLFEILERENQNLPDLSHHNSSTYTGLASACKVVALRFTDKIKEYTNLKGRLDALNNSIETAEQNLNTSLGNIKAAKLMIEAHLSSIIDDLEIKLASLSKAEELEKILSGNLELVHTLTERKENSENILSLLQSREKYYDPMLLDSIKDDISNYLLSKVGSSVDKIRSIKVVLDKTPVYNFGKRNSLSKEINTLTESYVSEVSDIIEQYDAEYNNILYDTNVELETLNSTNHKLRDRINRNNQLINKCALYKTVLTKIQTSETEIAPDLLISINTIPNLDLKKYEDAHNSYLKIGMELSRLKKLHTELSDSVFNSESTAPSKDEMELLSNYDSVLSKIKIGNISYGLLFKNLQAQYRVFDEVYTSSVYRHKLYLRLLLCSLYYGKISYPDNYLNIDEAQDLSVSEYWLLKDVLGDYTVNLYGDINQAVYSFKGISEWESIPGIKDDKVYVLNENYRNTCQITEYCNKVFGSEVMPIGISGERVYEESLTEAISRITSELTKAPDLRAVIIYNHGNIPVLNNINDVLYLKSNNIEVKTVEEAKGLEFDIVVAVVDGMTENEKYIAFTRALNILSVVDLGVGPFNVEFVDASFSDETIPDAGNSNMSVDNCRSDEGNLFSNTPSVGEKICFTLSDAAQNNKKLGINEVLSELKKRYPVENGYDGTYDMLVEQNPDLPFDKFKKWVLHEYKYTPKQFLVMEKILH